MSELSDIESVRTKYGIELMTPAKCVGQLRESLVRPELVPVAQSTVHARFFNLSLGPTMTHGASNARKFARLHIEQHLVIGTPMQSLRRPLNASARRDFPMPKWWSMARSALAGTPIVHSATPLDAEWCGTRSAAWSIALADRCRAACPSIVRARYP